MKKCYQLSIFLLGLLMKKQLIFSLFTLSLLVAAPLKSEKPQKPQGPISPQVNDALHSATLGFLTKEGLLKPDGAQPTPENPNAGKSINIPVPLVFPAAAKHVFEGGAIAGGVLTVG